MTFSRNTFISVGVGTLFTAVLAGIILAQRVQNDAAVFLLFLSALLCSAMLVQSAISRFACLPTMMVLIYFLLFNIVPAIFQVSFNHYFWKLLTYDEGMVTTCAFLTLLFLVFFAIGQALASTEAYAKAVKTIRAAEQYRRTVYIAAVAFIAFLVGLIPIRLFGIGALLQSRGTVKDTVFNNLDQTAMGLFVYLPRAVLFTGFVLLLYGVTRHYARSGVQKFTVYLPLLILVMPLQMVVNFPGSQSRFWLFGMLITLGLMYVDFSSARRRLLLVMVFVIGTFTVFPISQQINRQEGFNFDIQIPDVSDYMVHGDFDGFQTTMNAMTYVEHFGHTYGNQILSAALFFVPRSIWSGKGYATGNFTSSMLGFKFNNLSSPIISELYIDGSFFLVVLGALALGYAYKRFDILMTAAFEVGGVTLYRLLMALICGFTIILMRGALLAVMSPIATSVGLVFLVIKAPQLASWLMRDPIPADPDHAP